MTETGKRIKARRIAVGLSVDELADKVGLSRATMFRYENGGIDKVSTTKLLPIAEALHTTPGWLMGWEEECDSSGSALAAIIADLNASGIEELTKYARYLQAQAEYKKEPSAKTAM